MPCAPSSRAVPPVETISTPSSTRPRANSTSPRLSDTLRSALLMRTSPASTGSTPPVAASAIVLLSYAHAARIVRVERNTARGDQPHGTRQQPVLDLMKELTGRRDVPMVRKLERFLQHDRPAVHALVHEMHRHTR